jgi:hypothetical protein
MSDLAVKNIRPQKGHHLKTTKRPKLTRYGNRYRTNRWKYRLLSTVDLLSQSDVSRTDTNKRAFADTAGKAIPIIKSGCEADDAAEE